SKPRREFDGADRPASDGLHLNPIGLAGFGANLVIQHWRSRSTSALGIMRVKPVGRASTAPRSISFSSSPRLMPSRAAASPRDSTPIPRLSRGELSLAEVVGSRAALDFIGSTN